ncbi:MAG: hypothetical protein IPG06_20395 [Haliea sp.]|nr:hypothetical protein [Haliea sp.]
MLRADYNQLEINSKRGGVRTGVPSEGGEIVGRLVKKPRETWEACREYDRGRYMVGATNPTYTRATGSVLQRAERL